MAKEITGKKGIREVWDFRLSKGCPYLFNSPPSWVCKVIDNNSPDGEAIILDQLDTGIPPGQGRDEEAVKQIFEWLYSIRDKHSRPHIELRKPVVKMINEANQNIAALVGQAVEHEKKGDLDAGLRLRAEANIALERANRAIKAENATLQQKISQLETGGTH